MAIHDDHVAHIREHGYMIAPGAIPRADVDPALADLFELFPTPEAFAAGEGDQGSLRANAFAGVIEFPFAGDALHRLIVHPELLRLAETVLGTSADLRIYQVSLWAKYAGATDYDQWLHCDFKNHTLVVPSDDPGMRQLITWVLLSDVAPEQGATRVVSRQESAHLPLGDYLRPDHPELYEKEVAAAGPAGTLFAYGPDVPHRGAAYTAPTGGRFTLTVSFRSARAEWGGFSAWPHQAYQPSMMRFMSRASVRERALFGFPDPGDPYWTPATLAGVATRYPDMDLGPYQPAKGSIRTSTSVTQATPSPQSTALM